MPFLILLIHYLNVEVYTGVQKGLFKPLKAYFPQIYELVPAGYVHITNCSHALHRVMDIFIN